MSVITLDITNTLAATIGQVGIVILGIGGSSLGTETIYHAFLNPFHNLSEDT